MPRIDHMNPPPNPFWGFVADMQDHPFIAAYAPRDRPHQRPRGETAAASTSDTNTNASTNANANTTGQQQSNAEDPPEVDPSTLRQEEEQPQGRSGFPFTGRRRRGSNSDEEGDRRRGWHGRRGCGRGHRGFGGPFGPANFPFGGPFWAGGANHNSPPPPPPGFGPGPHGRGGFHHHQAHGPHGPHHPHGPHQRHGHRGPSPPPPPGPPADFDLGQFLRELGSKVGIDLAGASESLGLDRFIPTHSNPDTDFEPKADIFDRTSDYTIHISLPGAKKSDIGVDWDGEHSSLRVAGVVHRPGVDEAMLGQLVVDGRKRETGVFEKVIKLGTRRDPATVDVNGITAKMTDGVLVVTVPKVTRPHEKREVPIYKSATPSPTRQEKEVLFSVDQEMTGTAEEPEQEIQLIDHNPIEKSETAKGKQAEHEAERQSRESSATVEAEPEREQLPAYNPVEHREVDDWEEFGSDEEGEFVKINVD